LPWYRAAGPAQWRTLAAAELGWTLDGMNMMLYALTLTTIQADFKLTSAVAGALASVTLVTSAIGGGFGGYFSDRFGRARVLAFSILTYSLFTGIIATSQTVWTLGLWRSLVGFGLGAVWSAGSVLVAETWPAKHRGKAIGFMQAGWAIGYLLAALLTAAVLPAYGWRPLFLMGIAPSLVAIWIWRRVPEPEVWRASTTKHRTPVGLLFRGRLFHRFAIATIVCACVQFAYWGLFTWIPAYLANPIAKGGAGLSIVKSSAWIVPAQIGAFFGYILFGIFADRFGRRPVFVAFVFIAAVLVPIYGLEARSPIVLLLLGPLIGFFAHGYFSVFGALLAELFPSSVRATAQGLAYNAGRGLGALAPIAIGAVADSHGVGSALMVTSVFFVAGGVMMMFLPETKGEALE
jgi:MFS family permease